MKEGKEREKIILSLTGMEDEKQQATRDGVESGIVVDPGSSHTVLNDMKHFLEVKELEEWLEIVTVTVEQERVRARATHRGTYIFCAKQGGVIKGTAYFAEISESILSTNYMQQEHGGKVSVTHEGTRHVLEITRKQATEREEYVLKAGVPMRLEGTFVTGGFQKVNEDTGDKEEDIEIEKAQEMSKSKICVQLSALEQSMLEHVRYGHVCDQKRADTIRGGGIKGAKMPVGVGRKLYCEVCAMAKMRRVSKTKTKREEPLTCLPGHVIQLDRLISPVESVNGYNSLIAAVDLGTRYAQVYLMKTKEMEEFLRDVVPQIIAEAANQRKKGDLKAADITIQFRTTKEGETVDEWMRIQADGEFESETVRWMWRKAGFAIQTTAGYTSEKNPFVERLNQTLAGTTRVMMQGAKMPQEMWADAITMAARIYNITAHSAFVRGKEKGKKGSLASPEMRRSGQIPNDRDMVPAFCPCVCFTTPDKLKLGKWDDRGELGIFCGWSVNNPHKYLVRKTGGRSVQELLATGDQDFKKIVESQHVMFDQFFTSCKEQSPLHRMFRDRRVARGTMRVDLREGEVFEFSGRGNVETIVEQVRRSARLEEIPIKDYDESTVQTIEQMAEDPGQGKSLRRVPSQQGKVGGAAGTGIKRMKKKKQLQQEIRKVEDEQRSLVGQGEEADKREQEESKQQESMSEKDRRRMERKIALDRQENMGGLLGRIGEPAVQQEARLKVYSTGLTQQEKRIEEEEEDDEEERDELERKLDREIADESLGGREKMSTARDHAGWDAANKEKRKIEAGDVDDVGVLVHEKPWRRGVIKMVQEADAKEILFNKIQREVFEEVDEKDIPAWAEVYRVEMIRGVKEGQGLEGGYALGELFGKSRLVVCDVARRKMKRRTDPNGPYADWVVRVVAVNADIEAKRIFFMLAGYFEIVEMWQGDARCAFTHCLVEKWVYIYIKMHPAMKEHFTPGIKVLRLRRYLYGLREAPRKWFDLLIKAVHDFGFRDLGPAYDKCLLFMRTETGGLAVVLLHTDDCLGWSTETGFMDRFDLYMKQKFDMISKRFGDVGEHVYTGLGISRSPKGWLVGQQKYIERMMVELRITEAGRKGGRQLPYLFDQAPLGHDDQEDGDEVELQREFGFEYASAAGMCIHLLQTRIDCDFTIRQLARFSKQPRRKHYEAMRHFLRYLKGNKAGKLGYNWGRNDGICAKINGIVTRDKQWNPEKDGAKVSKKRYMLEACCDSEHGGHEDGKQVYSYTIYANGGPICSKSIVTQRIAKSTMGAEALGCSDAQDKLEYYAEMLRRIEKIGKGKWGLSPECPVIIGDNESVIRSVVHDDGLETIHAPPHVRLKMEAVRVAVMDGEVEVAKVGTKMNPSDIGTKTLSSIANARFSGLVLNDLEGHFSD